MGRSPRLILTIRLMTLLCATLLVTSLRGQNASSLSKKVDPAGTGPMMNQLRALFAGWDLDGDQFLDREELAKGFRGPAARPHEPTPKAKAGAPPPRVKPDKDKGLTPDYHFLIQVDLNNDGLVSRDEFLNWAREYAVLQKNVSAAESKVAKAEAKLATRTTLSARLQAEIDLRTERQALQKLVALLPPFEKPLQQALKPPPEPKKGK